MRILILDNCPDFCRLTGSSLRQMGHQCFAQDDCKGALNKLASHDFDVLLVDIKVAGCRADGLHLIRSFIASNHQLSVVALGTRVSVGAAVEALQAGAIDYLAKPLNTESLECCLARIEKNRVPGNRKTACGKANGATSPETTFETQVPLMQAVVDLAARAAPTPTTLLILGESGTGKTTLARAIHNQSREKEGPLITVNCPSLSKELFESDLFGHVRGAFTGAVRDKPGKVAHAAGGTLFLDEIGELPLEIQPKLLRLIQEREYERVGDPATLSANVRVIAASNKNLGEEVRAGRFREDLFYRLNVIPLEVPALRERIPDLPGLAKIKLRTLAREMDKTVMDFSSEAMDAIRQYDWPGNLRELHNALEYALVMTTGRRIEVEHFPSYLRKNKPNAGRCQIGAMVSLETLERAQIEHILRVTTSREEAASVLGIDPTTLYRKRKRYSLTRQPEAISA